MKEINWSALGCAILTLIFLFIIANILWSSLDCHGYITGEIICWSLRK